MENIFSPEQILPLILSGISIMLAFAAAFIYYFQLSRKKIMLETQKRQELELKYQQELLENNIKIQEEERQRIAQDLHDEIGSKLNVLKIFLYQLKKKKNDQNAFEALAEDMDDILKKTIDVSRNISHQLLPPTLEKFGFFTAIQELVDDINIGNEIEVLLTILGDQKIRPSNQIDEINLFRICQELTTNSIKYKANEIKLIIDSSEEAITTSFKDNGPGYDPSGLKNKKGLGLRSIALRIQMLNAEIKDKSSIGHGAEYFITYNRQND